MSDPLRVVPRPIRPPPIPDPIFATAGELRSAVFWSVGYYPAGVRGVGPPGAMFVMSTEDWWGGTWYRTFRKKVTDSERSEIWLPNKSIVAAKTDREHD